MLTRTIFFILISVFTGNVYAQDSTLKRTEEAVVVTATRVPAKVNNIAVPVTVWNKAAILQTGAVKLNEVLQEQTGVFITNGSGSRAVGGGVFGNGLQLQGMSPEHTLVLIDGEPVNGRQGGILDLSRIAVGNVKSMEIIKGPFSSLYGSEAMGGVVNIITENPKATSIDAIVRYGSFNTLDVQTKAFLKKQKWSTFLFANAFTSKGFDLNKNDLEKTLDPYHNNTVQAKINYAINTNSSIQLNSRLFYGVQNSNYAINANQVNISGAANTLDFANSIRYQFLMAKKVDMTLSLYQNQYRYNQTLDSVLNKRNYYKDAFTQNFLRIENIANVKWQTNLSTIFGYGFTHQNVATTRYQGVKKQIAAHVFMQNEWRLVNKLQLSTGGRIDYNNAFGLSIQPKLATTYQVNKKIRFHFSVGSGFKAPDFRQLYLSFINNAADSYIIYGSEEFSLDYLKRQKDAGFIADILPNANIIKKLVPEQNIGWNAGLQYQNNRNVKLSLQVFKNDVQNLIQYIEVAKRFNGASVFSYININQAQTKGIETNIQFAPLSALHLEAGYQFLYSADKEILRQVKAGKVYGRNGITSAARVMTVNDYFGLQFRSKHLANFKVIYNQKYFSTALRFLYRSKWGVTDLDGNGFANMQEEFANGFLQVNLSASTKINKQCNVQVGINNLLNDTDARNLANVPGINFFATLSCRFSKEEK
jgi:outer membrane receptor for ferrienterochelin and colicins